MASDFAANPLNAKAPAMTFPTPAFNEISSCERSISMDWSGGGGGSSGVSGGGGGSEMGGGGGGGRATSTERTIFFPSPGLRSCVSGRRIPIANEMARAPNPNRTGFTPNLGGLYWSLDTTGFL